MKLKKDNLVIKRLKAFRVAGAKGPVTFKKKGGSAKVAVSKRGAVTVRKGAKKGTYRVKVAVRAAGNVAYAPAKRVVVLKIVVV